MRKSPKRDWEDPYYTYTERTGRLTIDVTASAPNFTNPVDGLSDVSAQHFRPRQLNRILDFGAGKLRHTTYLLQANSNYQVTAVEFDEAYKTAGGAQRLAAANRSPRVTLVTPRDFLAMHTRFDAVLLINVVNVVPDPADRKKIILECANRLRSRGLLLIMTQYGEPNYEPGATKRRSLNGGWCYNLRRKYKSYNIEFSLPQLRALVPSNLLREITKISSNHHRALLFEKF